MEVAESSIEKTVMGIRERAGHSRRVYNLTVTMMILLAVSLVLLFIIDKSFSIDRSARMDSFFWILISTSLIVRVGAVLIGLYTVQIMFRFARYHIRTEQHLEAAADALDLCGCNTEELAAMMKVLSPSSIDFGDLPTTPSDKVFEILSELTKKLPSAK